MKEIEIVFLGGGTAFFEVYEIIRRVNLIEKKYKVVAILDDNIELHGKFLNGVLIAGDLEKVIEYPSAKFIFGIGSLKTRLIRKKIMSKLNLELTRFETIIHPQTNIDPTAIIHPGCIIHPGVCIGNDATIEPFVVIAVNSAIGPNSHIKSFAMITSLVVILSNAIIGKSVFVGSCSCITESVEVGDGTMIGVGSVISRNLPSGTFFLGNPARMINKFEIPQDL